MKLNLNYLAMAPLGATALSVVNSAQEHSPSGQAPMLQNTEDSFMDSIYGQLVASDSSRQHKVKLLSQGFSRASNEYDAAHQSFVNIQSKLRLPPDDDTSDINQSQNMFGGILTYAHFNTLSCFDPSTYDTEAIDIAIVGAPFDTGTSYRPGARFGPEAIRSASRRLGDGRPSSGHKKKGYPLNPYDSATHNYSIVDCGDVAMTPFDNRIALNQLYRGQRAIHQHQGNVGKTPKIITVGGDHTITLMALKSVHEALGEPVHVIHFDSHLDTWDPKVLGGGITDYMSLNHGTFLHYAHEQGYIRPQGNWHVGIRAPYIDEVYDGRHDSECGFSIIRAVDIDRIGVHGIVKALKHSLGRRPVYITVDIDVLDPAHAPATGTMEIGGFSGRELLSMLNQLRGLNVVGADVVEVSPPFDTNSGITSLAATSVIDSFLHLMTAPSE